ncbi:MAG: acetate--CoA ligase [Alphaproteobacteria bacterium]|nr:acetate--CoA ligase [Alphaproteobacteria bacterium]
MSDIFPVDPATAAKAWINAAQYKEMYARSIKDPDSFWGEMAKGLKWIKPFRKVKNASFEGEVLVRWFEDGTLNVAENCIDRHLPERAYQTAIIWEGDEPNQQRLITYAELHREVCRFANVLKAHGLQKGDTATIYMPMIPEAAFAMLACARIGVIHSVVFGGFSPTSLRDRIQDCHSRVVITADEGIRGGKKIPLKANVDEAIRICPHVHSVLVVRHTGNVAAWDDKLNFWYHDEAAKVSDQCPPVEMSAEDPLFILYTSGSTGTPKGVLHTTGGYLLYAALTHKYVFDYHDGDVYWCTADVGWVTGHSYILYGPLANGATTLMYEGVPNYPDHSRFWQVVDKHKVTIFYTAPTAIRALMREGDDFVKRASRKSLRLMGSVGEPINPEAWLWYHRVVGEGRCPVIDTWWQTETGGHMITPLPGATALKPGSATLPFFGVEPIIVDQGGEELHGEAEGILCIKGSWPGMMRTLWKNHERYKEGYFKIYPGRYFTGDGCRRDADGYYWITGRVDDVINVAGHRLSTAEIESALVAHPKVAEAAVVGCQHEIKGQGIYAFITLKTGEVANDELHRVLVALVRKTIGPIATPDFIQWATGLPKTRSGKIMRRILRKIVAHEEDGLGDTSTLADPSVVQGLIKNRVN